MIRIIGMLEVLLGVISEIRLKVGDFIEVQRLGRFGEEKREQREH